VRLRTHEVARDGMVTAALYMGWSAQEASTEDAFVGVIHADEAKWLSFLDTVSERGRREIDRGTCTAGCGHPTHTGERCAAAMTVLPGGTEACCACGGDPGLDEDEYPTPADQEAIDNEASGERF
jgi:hypothetical protein